MTTFIGGWAGRIGRVAGTFWLGLCVLASGPVASLHAEVLRTPPPVYTETLSALLTPVTEVLPERSRVRDRAPAGATLLDESVIWVDEAGRRTWVRQVAYVTLTEAGVRSNAEDVFGYRRGLQRFYLLAAEAIQPDGTVQPVRPNAVLEQSPARQAEYALYDDQAEVRIIYPNVKPGTVTRALYIVEDVEARMPGEFAARFSWGRQWEVDRDRRLIDLPAALAARLRVEEIGTGAPKVVIQPQAGGRTRYEWSLTQRPAQRYEIGRAPSDQTGPAVAVSTIADWSAVGRWFAGLLQGRDTLPPALAAEVDAWTVGVTDRAALIQLLLTKVSVDVRYTGLELGAADYQPHACAEVWENRYGDCKDKANLLAAFLRHKGIPAHLALVNTEHLGLIDRRCPDFRVFTHAITAIPDGTGGYVFCDPTISQATPGMLAPSSSEREVLVVEADGATWVRTPPADAGAMRYDFDLTLAANGELSGWLAITAEGYYGAWQRTRYQRLEPEEQQRKLTGSVQEFFPGAEVVDVSMVDAFAATGPSVVRGFFVVPATAADPAGGRALGFPRSGSLLNNLGTSPERDTDYVVYPEQLKLVTRVQLPAGWSVAQAPEIFEVDTPLQRLRAAWIPGAGELRMELETVVRGSSVPPAEFARVYRALQGVRAWLERPATLTTSSVGLAPVVTTELDFPLMPTGAGQLDLLERRYPSSGSRALRRAALERTIQAFPHDVVTQFGAGVRLAVWDWEADKNQEALDRLLPLLATARGVVPAGDFGWAENVHGLILRDLKRFPEAREVFIRLARDEALSSQRRAQNVLNAIALAEPPPADDVLALLQLGAGLPSTVRPEIIARLGQQWLAARQPERLRALLADLLAQEPKDGPATLAAVFGQAERLWTSAEDLPRRADLAELLAALLPNPDEELKTKLTATRAQVAQLILGRDLQARLRAALNAPPLAGSYLPPPEVSFPTGAAYRPALDAAEAKGDRERALRIALAAVLETPVDEKFPEHLWRAAAYADWQERRPGHGAGRDAILTLLLELCDVLPAGSEYFIEGKFLQAKRLVRADDGAGARAVIERMLALPDLDERYVVSGYGRLGEYWDAADDEAAALRSYTQLEPYVTSYAHAADKVLRTVFIHLRSGDTAAALRVLGVLALVPDNVLAKTTGADQLRELVRMAKDGWAESYWTATAVWWKQWESVAKALRVPAETKEARVPVVPDLPALMGSLETAAQRKDTKLFFAHYAHLLAAARWSPTYAVQATARVGLAVGSAPASVVEVRRLLADVVSPVVPPSEPLRRNFHLLRAANLIDLNEPRRALETVQAVASLNAGDDDLAVLTRRMGAMAALALKENLPAATQVLETDLARTGAIVQRGMAVTLLADLYHAQDRAGDENELLRRELLHPDIAGDAALRQQIQSRLARLGDGERLATQARRWVQTAGLAWFEVAEPASLEDPRLTDLDRLLQQPDGTFNSLEWIKVRLLAAQASRLGPDVQRRQWIEAFNALHEVARSEPELAALQASILDDEELDRELQEHVLWLALTRAARIGRSVAFDRWRHHALARDAALEWRDELPALDQFVAVPRQDPSALVALAQQWVKAPLSTRRLALLGHLFSELQLRGWLDAAETLVKSVPQWRAAPGASLDRDAMRLDLVRGIRASRETLPLWETMQAAVLPALGRAPETLSASAADDRVDLPLIWREPAQTLAQALYLLEHQEARLSDAWFWRNLLRSVAAKPGREAFIADFTARALAAVKTDRNRTLLLLTITTAVDMDHPGYRDPVLAAFRAAVPASDRSTSSILQMLEINSDLRAGRMIDLPGRLAGIVPGPGMDAAMLRAESLRLRLVDLLAREAREQLRQLVDATATAELLHEGVVDVSAYAWAQLERPDEAELARERALHHARRTLASAWATGDEWAVSRLLRTARLLHAPELLPSAWLDSLDQTLPNEVGRMEARIVHASLQQDWPRAARLAQAAVEKYPTHYELWWQCGEALYHLGQHQEAADALRTFTAFAKSDPAYPRAVAWLRKLEDAAVPTQ